MDETAQTRRAALRITNFCRSPMISASIPSVVESGILRLSHSTGFVGEKVRLRGRECRAHTSYLLLGHAPAPPASGAPRDQIGRAPCRERVCQSVSISVVPVPLKKKKNKQR